MTERELHANVGNLLQYIAFLTALVVLDPAGVLVVAGRREQVDGLNRRLAQPNVPVSGAVLIIGAGRVGQATAINWS